MKALLLNGAIKPFYQANLSEHWVRIGTEPLDRRYGAGILNIFNSYKQLQAGQRGPGSYGYVRSGWDFNSVAAASARTYSFVLTGGPYTATATLVWNRRQNQSSINNLNLSLSSDGVPFASSVSTVDNVEHIFLEALQPGTYDLKVERIDDVVSGPEQYALAFDFAPVVLTGAVSRKMHGGADSFDIPLPLSGAPGIECRTGGANGEHQIVLSFAVPVTFSRAEMTTGAGSIAGTSGSGTNTVTVNLTGVANAQTTAVTLFGLNDETSMTNVTVKMGVLLGDTTGNATVNSSDITQTKVQSGLPVTGTNFRNDVNVNGAINSSDISMVKDQVGTALP